MIFKIKFWSGLFLLLTCYLFSCYQRENAYFTPNWSILTWFYTSIGLINGSFVMNQIVFFHFKGWFPTPPFITTLWLLHFKIKFAPRLSKPPSISYPKKRVKEKQMDTNFFPKEEIQKLLATKNRTHLWPALAIRWLCVVNCALRRIRIYQKCLSSVNDYNQFIAKDLLWARKGKFIKYEVESQYPTENMTNKNHYMFQINLC